MTSLSCIFCKILEKKIPSSCVYEDEKTYAFLDINPINKGHTLVIPKRHASNFVQMTEDEAEAVYRTAHKVATAVTKATSNDDFNLVMNNGTVAGQMVFHAHCHVIPREERGELGGNWRTIEYGSDGEKEAMRKKIADEIENEKSEQK